MSFSKVLGVHVPIFYFFVLSFFFFLLKIYISIASIIKHCSFLSIISLVTIQGTGNLYITNLPHQTFYLSRKIYL